LNNCNGISPSGYKVLIQPDEVKEEVSPGGIVIPESEREKYQNAQTTGVVRALGPYAWRDQPPEWAGIGDRILYDRYTGMSVSGEDGTEYRLINDTQVLAVISEEIKTGELERRTAYER
jgi:co-chaperonin GroES (HSP10)